MVNKKDIGKGVSLFLLCSLLGNPKVLHSERGQDRLINTERKSKISINDILNRNLSSRLISDSFNVMNPNNLMYDLFGMDFYGVNLLDSTSTKPLKHVAIYNEGDLLSQVSDETAHLQTLPQDIRSQIQRIYVTNAPVDEQIVSDGIYNIITNILLNESDSLRIIDYLTEVPIQKVTWGKIKELYN